MEKNEKKKREKEEPGERKRKSGEIKKEREREKTLVKKEEAFLPRGSVGTCLCSVGPPWLLTCSNF